MVVGYHHFRKPPYLLDRPTKEAGGDPSGRRGMNAIDTACALGATRALRVLLELPPSKGALRTVYLKFQHNFWGSWWFYFLGGGFKYLLFSPLPGEMIQFDFETTN